MDSLLDRLTNAYNFLRSQGAVHTKTDFAVKLGMTPSQITDAFKDRNRRLTEGLMKRIVQAFPIYVDEQYMLTGKGEIDTGISKALSNVEYRPHIIDTTVSAGFMSGIGENGNVEIREINRNVPDYDFSIEVTGMSMSPNILPGDTIYCRKVTNRYEQVEGKLCIIDSSEGGVIKIIADDQGDSLTLHSFNPEYKDYKIPKQEINQIARVVGLSRAFC